MKHVVLMCLLLYIHTSESEIFNRSVTVGKDVTLMCNEGKVLWSKDRNGTRVEILIAEKDGETRKLISDPHNRYCVLDDLSLHIKSVSLSDSAIYYCNATPTVNLRVTEQESTTSNNRQTETTPPTPESTTSSYSQPGATTPTPVISINTSSKGVDQSNHSNFNNSEFNSTEAIHSPISTPRTSTNVKNKDSTTSSYSQPGATTSTPAIHSPKSTPRTSTNLKNKESTTSNYSQPGANTSTPERMSTSITAAVSGGVVFLVLILLLWACIKRKSLSTALSNKHENIYETVDDGYSTAKPAPPQKTNDAIYYLAGDPDIVKLGQRQEIDDSTYTLIGLSESKSKENLTEQGQDVPLYSTIKEFSE